jgi:hypothetical protein
MNTKPFPGVTLNTARPNPPPPRRLAFERVVRAIYRQFPDEWWISYAKDRPKHQRYLFTAEKNGQSVAVTGVRPVEVAKRGLEKLRRIV